MYLRIYSLVAIWVGAVAAVEDLRVTNHSVLRVEFPTDEVGYIDELLSSNGLIEEVWQRRTVATGYEIDILVSSASLKNVTWLLARRRLRARVLSSVFNNCGGWRERYQSQTQPLPALLQLGEDFFADYRQLGDINAFLRNLAADYPKLATVFEIGVSWEARKILAVRITAPSTSDAQKPMVFLEAGIHSRWAH
jgi:hypothetical protein